MKSLMLAVLLFSLGLSWVAVEIQRAKRQRRIVDEIVACGGTVQYKYETDEDGAKLEGAQRPLPPYLRRLLGEDFLTTVVSVELYDDAVREHVLLELKRFPAIESLTVLDVTDGVLAHVEDLSSLRELVLYRVQISPEALTCLENLPRLKTLTLTGHDLGGGILRALGRANQLERLSIASPKLTDADIDHLEGLTNLRELKICPADEVTQDALKELQRRLPDTVVRSGGLRPDDRDDYVPSQEALAHYERGRSHVLNDQWAEALREYTEAIRLDPKYATAYSARAVASGEEGQADKAMEDFKKALQLEPGSPFTYLHRGLLHARAEKFDKAVADLTEAIRWDYGFPESRRDLLFLRGDVLRLWGKYGEAIADYEAVAEGRYGYPGVAAAYGNLAWIRATCPNVAYRNGKQALEDAELAARMNEWEDPIYLDILAAAYAETGDFESAIDWQEEAIEMLPDTTSRELVTQFTAKLEHYRAGKPWRDPPAEESEDRRHLWLAPLIGLAVLLLCVAVFRLLRWRRRRRVAGAEAEQIAGEEKRGHH